MSQTTATTPVKRANYYTRSLMSDVVAEYVADWNIGSDDQITGALVHDGGCYLAKFDSENETFYGEIARFKCECGETTYAVWFWTYGQILYSKCGRRYETTDEEELLAD